LMQMYQQGTISIEAICELQAEAVGDRTETELAEVYNRVAVRVAATVRTEVRELLCKLKSRGWSIHVVSGSLGDAVERCCSVAGIPFDSVAGATLVRSGQTVVSTLARATPLHGIKIERLQEISAWPCALGIGDGGWDAPFLGTVFLPVLVHPKPALVEAMRDVSRTVILG
jgi:phosphoserine phosphatase